MEVIIRTKQHKLVSILGKHLITEKESRKQEHQSQRFLGMGVTIETHKTETL